MALSVPEGSQVQQVRVKTLQIPTQNLTRRRKSVTAIDAKRKGRFLIDSESLRAAKGRVRGYMKCEVERDERGTDLTIEDWINQMETYYTVGQVPPEA